MHSKTKRIIWSLLLLFIAVALACSIPGITQPSTPQPTEVNAVEEFVEEADIVPTLPALPTATLQPLPPALVEVEPPPGSDLPPLGIFTFYFNQPMDKPSVELALSGQPTLSGRFTWLNDSTVVFESDAPLPPDSEISICINTSALAKNGQFLQNPITLQYQVTSPLKVTQLLPEPGMKDVDPTSAIVAAFNQPVVAFKDDPGSLPEPLTIDPPIAGNGEWFNNSTYIYYPESALAGGMKYTIHLNPTLTSTSGGPFEGRGVFEINAFEWSFETALPRLVSISPGDGAVAVGLDTVFRVEFSHPMDTTSVEENFFIFDPWQNAVEGVSSWDEQLTTLIFTPTNLLSRDTNYNLALLDTARTIGGTSMGFDTVARFRTAPEFRIVNTEPENNGIKQLQANLSINFNGPAKQVEDPFQFIGFSPSVSNLSHWWGDFNRTLNIQGDFRPLSIYTVTISNEFPDPWGSSISEPYTFTFQTTALSPAIFVSHGGSTLALRPQDSTINAQITNIEHIEMRLGSVPFDDLVEILAPGSYNLYQNYQPEDLLYWTHNTKIPGDKTYTIQLPITPGGLGLDSGIYYLGISSPELINQLSPYLLVSTNVQLAFKLSTTSAFVWAVDLRTMEPVAGLPVTVYDNTGVRLTSGPTDSQGIFQSPITTQPDLYTTYYAVMAKPGDEFFSLSLSNWAQGIEDKDFGLDTDYAAPDTNTFLYTDSAKYHPGQRIYYRGVVRHEHNGRYALPGFDTIPVTIFNGDNEPIQQLDQKINEFGTIQGEFLLPEDAQTGTYRIATLQDMVYFKVVENRKPEIDLTLDAPQALIAGEEIEAEINAKYSFNVPAGNIPLSWRVYRKPISFNIPGFQTGLDPYGWLNPPWQINADTLGELISSGEAQTNSEGRLVVSFPTDTLAVVPYQYTLEAMLKDGDDFPIRYYAVITVHPGDFYIGLRPDTWIGLAGSEIGFDVNTVDWLITPAVDMELTAWFREVSWTKTNSVDPFDYPNFTPEYKTVSSADLITGKDGLARLVFTPPRAGIYQLEVSGHGAQTTILVWVEGPEQVIWPSLPNNHIKLTADKGTYLPGDTTTIFIPNPLEPGTKALITVERDEVLRYDLIRLDSSGTTYPLTLTEQDSPNVYISVTLVGHDTSGRPDFRMGFLNLEIKTVEKELNIALNLPMLDSEGTPCLEPGGKVDLKVQISDYMGRPVHSEFSLLVRDLGSPSLSESNMVDILEAFYGEQALGIRTSMTLAVDSRRWTIISEDMASGEEGYQDSIMRQDVPVTAFWQANVLTNQDGEAYLTLTLPNNPSAYQIEVQVVSADTLVGQVQDIWNTSNELWVQPVLPNFLVAGDYTEIAAEIYNQSANDLLVDVSLQANGFTLDKPNDETQQISIPTHGSTQVTWLGRVEETTFFDLKFSALGVGCPTSTKLDVGNLPIFHFVAPQTFNSAGILDLEGESLEAVSLPGTYHPTAATLEVTLAPSLAAAMIDGLDFLENYPYASAEQILSSFLPNLIAYRTIQDLGLESPNFSARFERTMESGIQELTTQQNEDGGWGWWLQEKGKNTESPPSHTSDSNISAYILLGLNKAKRAGVFVDESVIEKGRNYLLATLPSLEMLSSTWQLDQLAFHYLALSLTGESVTSSAKDFFDVRNQLSPYAEAFLVLTLGINDPRDSRIDTILTDLEFSAIPSDTGIYWEGKSAPSNLDTPIMNTSIVVYTLAQYDPASHLIPEALSYLMVHRKADGSWGSTYETAWTLLALTEVMKGTGELAGDFAYAASLNGEPIIEGQAGGNTRLNAVSATIPADKLYPGTANGLSIQRSAGPGRLYYTAHLKVYRLAVEAEAQSHGIHITRSYRGTNDDKQAAVGDLVTVSIAFSLENDAHYLLVEDTIPAGAEILDTHIKHTLSNVVECGKSGANCYLPRAPFSNGWGWWWFEEPLIYDGHITWAADYAPAGTYVLTYTLVLTSPGEFQVLPAKAWQAYLPEIFGNSAGEIFTVEN